MTVSGCWRRDVILSNVVVYERQDGKKQGKVREIREGNGRGKYDHNITYICMKLSKCKEI